jgi:invasion protein IalB
MFFANRPARPHQAAATLVLAGLGLGLATAPALAQPKKPAAPAPAAPAQPAAPAAQGQQQTGPMVVQVKAEPSQADWTKVCGKDQGSGNEVCYTTRDFVSDQGQAVLAVAVYDMKGPQGAKVVRCCSPASASRSTTASRRPAATPSASRTAASPRRRA